MRGHELLPLLSALTDSFMATQPASGDAPLHLYAEQTTRRQDIRSTMQRAVAVLGLLVVGAAERSNAQALPRRSPRSSMQHSATPDQISDLQGARLQPFVMLET